MSEGVRCQATVKLSQRYFFYKLCIFFGAGSPNRYPLALANDLWLRRLVLVLLYPKRRFTSMVLLWPLCNWGSSGLFVFPSTNLSPLRGGREGRGKVDTVIACLQETKFWKHCMSALDAWFNPVFQTVGWRVHCKAWKASSRNFRKPLQFSSVLLWR